MPCRTKEEQIIYQRKWIAARRAAFFSGKLCVKCGSTERLELDHINPKDKVTHSIWSWSKIRQEKEIAKCQVLCHDCHKEKSSIEISGHGTNTHGTISMYKKGCRCEPCKENDRNRYLRSSRHKETKRYKEANQK